MTRDAEFFVVYAFGDWQPALGDYNAERVGIASLTMGRDWIVDHRLHTIVVQISL